MLLPAPQSTSAVKTHTTLVILATAARFLLPTQTPKAEVPFTIGYFDNPWDSLRITNQVYNGYESLAAGHFNLVHSVGYDQGIGGTYLDRALTNGLSGIASRAATASWAASSTLPIGPI